jgi:hypothetical protein
MLSIFVVNNVLYYGTEGADYLCVKRILLPLLGSMKGINDP